MTALIDDSYEGCNLTANWLSKGAIELGSQLGNATTVGASEHPSKEAIIAFYDAIRTGNLETAVGLCHSSKAWRPMVLQAIDQLDRDWQDDALMIGDVAEAYWSIRRVINEVSFGQTQKNVPRLRMGTAAIYLPSNEQHTFGPQLLSDQLTRIGWDVELWIEDENRDALAPLSMVRIDVLGISVGSDDRLDGLADKIIEIRQKSLNPDLFVLVGGSALRGGAEQYRFLGADRLATDADDTIDFFSGGWHAQQRLDGRYEG